jgi:hypothetical protein
LLRPSVRITVGEDGFDFVLSEELDGRVVPDEEKLAAAKYSWQRFRLPPAPAAR